LVIVLVLTVHPRDWLICMSSVKSYIASYSGKKTLNVESQRRLHCLNGVL